MRSEVIIVMARTPQLGKVKTRLAVHLGPEKTLEIYKYLLQYTLEVCEKAQQEFLVFWTEKPSEHSGEMTHIQKGNDLGERMRNALEVAQASKMVLIGTDCLELTTSIIHDAFEALATRDVVFGPAKDGGYYLIGLKKPHTELFTSMQWSTSKVLQESIERCTQLKISYALLPMLSDIDTIDDLQGNKILNTIKL